MSRHPMEPSLPTSAADDGVRDHRDVPLHEIHVAPPEEKEDQDALYSSFEEGARTHSEDPISVDEALTRMGGFGRFQWIFTLVLGIVSVVDGLAVLSMVFVARRDPKTQLPFPGTIGEEWNLTGEKEWLVGLADSLFFLGWLVGAGIFGFLSDRIGRKKSILAANMVFFCGVFLSASSWNFDAFVGGRMLMGAGIGGQGLINFVWSAEFWPPASRATAGCLYSSFFAFGFLALSVVASYFTNWRRLMVVTALPMLLFVTVWNWLPESPRWLMVHGKMAQSMEVFALVCRFNGATMPTQPIEQTGGSVLREERKGGEERRGEERRGAENKSTAEGHISVLDLFRTPVIRLRTLVCMFLWFTCSFVYFGMSLFSGSLSGDFSLNVFLMALVELPAYVLAWAVLRKGRRPAMFCFMVGTGVCSLAVLIDPPPWLATAFALAGKFAISGAFSCAYLYSAELFPTSARNMGTGLSSQAARIGGMSAPLIVRLSSPLLIFGSVACVASFLSLLLPETLHASLPETISGLQWHVMPIAWKRLIQWVRAISKTKPYTQLRTSSGEAGASRKL